MVSNLAFIGHFPSDGAAKMAVKGLRSSQSADKSTKTTPKTKHLPPQVEPRSTFEKNANCIVHEAVLTGL